MSQSQLYGYSPYELKPGPDFRTTIDRTGKYTGSMSFTCRKFDYSSAPIQAKIKRGAAMPTVYPELGADWDFLLIDSAEHEHQPGGITRIFVTFEGVSPTFTWESDPDGEGSYSLNAALMERDIILHPKVQACPSIKELTALFNGTGSVKDWGTLGSSIEVIDANQRTIGTITDSESILWYGKIFTDGIRSYQAPTAEWTQTKTNRGGIVSADLTGHGFIDASPGGNPPTFTGRNWLYTGVTENRTRGGGDSTVTWSKTWQLSAPGEEWDTEIYTD